MLSLWVLMLSAWPAHAQAIRLDIDATPLAEALSLLRTQAALDVVYAERQVVGRTVSCRYEGGDAEAALACLLAGTGLRAERVRRRQYVLASAPGQTDVIPLRVPRGLVLGFVTDAQSGEVLPGAHVYLPDLRLGAVTNEAGYFAIPSLPVGPYTVRISYLGYASRDTVLVAGATAAEVSLEPQLLLTSEVVVEAEQGDPLEVAAVPGVVTVPVQDLETLPSFPGEPDLFQALRWIPGVQKAGEINGGLNIRGGASDQNLYLLDGAPLYYPWHAFSLISTFQTETFKDIKLYRGSFPAEHGGRLSAVLDAEMRDGSQARARAVGAISLLSGRFIAEAPVGPQLSFMVSGRRSYLDKVLDTEHPVEENGRQDTLRTGYFFFDTSAKLTWRPATRHRLSLSYYGGEDNLDLRLPFELTNTPADWLRPLDLFFEIDHAWGNRLTSLRHQFLYSRRLFITTTLYRSGYKADERVFLRPTDATSVRSDYAIRLRDYGLKVDLDAYPSLEHQVRAGFQVVGRSFRSFLDADVQRSLGVIDTIDTDSRLEAAEVVAYVQDSWQPAPHWLVQPGLRVSFFSSGPYLRLSPRLSARYAVDPDWLVVRAGAGVQWQYLHRLRDRYSVLYDLVSSRWVPASGSVAPGRSVQVAVGAESHPVPWLTLAADAYWRTSGDILLPRDVYQTKDGLEGPGVEVGTLLGQYTAGDGRASGIELAVRAENGLWRLWLSYAGGRSRNRAPKLGEIDFHPTRFEVPRALNGLVGRQGRHWSLSVASEWRSGYPTTVPVARYSLGDPLDPVPVRYLYRPDVNNGRLPPYLRFDVTTGYRFRLFGARVHTKLYLYNVTNRRNVIDRVYDPAPEGGVLVEDRRGLFLLPNFELQVEL